MLLIPWPKLILFIYSDNAIYIISISAKIPLHPQTRTNSRTMSPLTRRSSTATGAPTTIAAVARHRRRPSVTSVRTRSDLRNGRSTRRNPLVPGPLNRGRWSSTAVPSCRRRVVPRRWPSWRNRDTRVTATSSVRRASRGIRATMRRDTAATRLVSTRTYPRSLPSRWRHDQRFGLFLVRILPTSACTGVTDSLRTRRWTSRTSHPRRRRYTTSVSTTRIRRPCTIRVRRRPVRATRQTRSISTPGGSIVRRPSSDRTATRRIRRSVWRDSNRI